MNNIGVMLQSNPLVKLIQQENFVGWIYGIDYDSARVMTNDLWKARTLGIPHNCFLLATPFDPEQFHTASEAEREVVLLRVVGSAHLPQDDDLVRTKIDKFQGQTSPNGVEDTEYDDLTRNQMQFGGLACRVLGTFFMRDNELRLGSDLESFANAARLNVYRPRIDALKAIVNHVDPDRRKAAEDEAKQLGFDKPVAPIQIGTVRYTSTDRLHRQAENEKVAFFIQPYDFLARRTAVFGMTRTGKSNMVKQTVSVVKGVADKSGVKIGQIIYDINGEYANANKQDKGAIADIYPQETVRYRMLKTEGFEELQNNFYVQLNEGLAQIRQVLQEKKSDTQGDVNVFLNVSLDEPDKQDVSAYLRWCVRTAIYRALLGKAGFDDPEDFKIAFKANKSIMDSVSQAAGKNLADPAQGLTLDAAIEWFAAARDANRASTLLSTSGKPWLDDESKAMLNMMAQKNENNTFINGYKVLADARKYHSPRRAQEVGKEIYAHLCNGKIVILDLSVGDSTIRSKISQQIATEIFNRSMNTFTEGGLPPNILVYIEEAHNLIGKGLELTETWPRLAKEGAKYRIGLVYATQEVSSIHPNILANTENWFVTHLNNEREIKELGRFYDFEDFSRSLLRAQDVGFARVKMLSSPFVVPVQIDKFSLEGNKQA